MISATLAALDDVRSRELRPLFWRALGLTVALFAAVLVVVEALLWFLASFPWPWLETVVAILAGFGLIAAFFFLMAPVTAIFAGFYLDEVALRVEQRNFPGHRPGRTLSAGVAMVIGLQFAFLVLLINLALLPMVFFGIGPVIMLAGNAYLLGREYFSMIAMRHMPVSRARALRKMNAGRIFAAGLIPALLALVPVVSVFVPIFATCYFVHVFKQIDDSMPE